MKRLWAGFCIWIVSQAISFGAARVIGQWPTEPRGGATEMVLLRNHLYVRTTAGVVTLDASNPGAFRRVGSFGDNFTTPVAAGPYLWLSGYDKGLVTATLLDTTQTSNPVPLFARTDFSNLIPAGIAAWPYLYAWGERPFRLKIWDFTNPAEPVERIAASAETSFMHGMLVEGNIMVAHEWNGPIYFYDITDRLNPVRRGSYSVPHNLSRIRVDGNFAYIGTWQGLDIVDISNLDQPTRAGFWTTPKETMAFDAANGIVVLGIANLPTIVLDVSDPANPVQTAELPSTALYDVIARGTNWLVSDYYAVKSLDMTDPAQPQELASISVGPDAQVIHHVGNRLYLHEYGDSIKMLDVSNPARPQDTGVRLPDFAASIVEGTNLFAVSRDGTLFIYDVTHPDEPRIVSEFASQSLDAVSLALANELLFVANWTGLLEVIDVSDRQAPQPLTTFNYPSGVRAITARGNYIYATAQTEEGGLHVFDATDRDAPSHVRSVSAPASYGMVIAGQALYLTVDQGISMWSLADPANPASRGVFGIDLQHNYIKWLTLGEDGRLYATGFVDGPTGLAINKLVRIDINSPFAPTIDGEIGGLRDIMRQVASWNNVVYAAAGASGILIFDFESAKPTLPTLEIHRDGDMHRVRWLSDWTDFALKSAPTLNGPWRTEKLGYSATGLFNEAGFPNLTNRFYRLEKNVAP